LSDSLETQAVSTPSEPNAPNKPTYRDDFEFPVTVELGPGLEGAITNKTKIGYVDGQAGRLVYRGYSIEDLCERSTYEETAYLLVFGRLPTLNELENFKGKLKRFRTVPDEVVAHVKRLAPVCHPMATLRTAVSKLGALDPKAEDVSLENETELGIQLISCVATLVAMIGRIRKGEEPVASDPRLDHAANFLWMLDGEKPDPFHARVMDSCFIMHADHGMAASTMIAIMVSASLSDMYSAIVGAIASLKGPLHGGANERVIEYLLTLDDEGAARAFVRDCVARKERIYGFGHRVYKTYDPRARILKRYCEEASRLAHTEKLLQIAGVVEDEVIKVYGEKGIFPNVDFYSPVLYHAMGIEGPLFTPIFAASRTAGWLARILEYRPENRIFRPRAVYVGEHDRAYVPVNQRV